MTKYLLIQPPGNYIVKRDGEKGAKLAVPPLGLLYIAEFLRSHGHLVEVLDCQVEDFSREEIVVDIAGVNRNFRGHKIIRYGLSKEDIYKKIVESSPDIVGISCLQCTRLHEAHEVANIAKMVAGGIAEEKVGDKKITTVIGGQYGTSLYNEALLDGNVDYCCLGEGEYPMLSLSGSSEVCSEVTMQGLAHRVNDKVKVYKRIDELDVNSVGSMPAWDLIDLKKYADINLSPNRRTKDKNFAIMITSRGCVHNCEYCPARNVFGQKWRSRSAEHIVREIDHLITNYNIGEIQFEDSDIVASKSRMLDICGAMKKNRLNISWCSPHGIAVQKLDNELLDAMYESGCYALHLSVEFGSTGILEKVKPTVNLDYTKDIVKYARKLGMDVTMFTMIGHYNETKSDVMKTIDYTVSCSPDAVYYFLMQPMPGTKLYTFCKDNSLLVNDFQWSNLRYSIQNIKNKNFYYNAESGESELEDIRRDAWLDYMGTKKEESKYDFWRE